MTIQFIPGDPNRSSECLSQAHWKNHHIIAYGSGNNLIISTSTDGNKSIQTIYFDSDPASIDIHPRNGLICASSGNHIVVLKPVNEYMSIPKWTEALRIDNESEVLCFKWAHEENELAVGSTGYLSLYHVYDEYGEIKHFRRWHQNQVSPTEHLDVTANANKIVTYNSSTYDNFAKVWLRINYGDSNTLFDPEYLDHSPDVWITGVKWRLPTSKDEENIEAMAHIKNLRSYIQSEDESDVLYVSTSDLNLHVWATYDFSGHTHIKQWASLPLAADLSSDYVASIILENSVLQTTLFSALAKFPDTTQISEAFKALNQNTSDLLLTWGSDQSLVINAILNVGDNPPNSIRLQHITTMTCNRHCIPNYSLKSALEAVQNESVSSEEFKIAANSIVASHVVADTSAVQFLIHDRKKNTLRYNALDFTPIFKGKSSAISLKNKYQGHAKTIQKLVTSTSSFEGNILLSISNFPEHNYIWEPLLLEPENVKHMSITKRFRLNVTRDDEGDQGILDAVLINDIKSIEGPYRRHVAFVIEKGGYCSLWDCNGLTMDDKDAELLAREEIHDSDGLKIMSGPMAISQHELEPGIHSIIAIFSHDLVRGWVIEVGDSTISMKKHAVANLPGSYQGFCSISAVDTYLEKDISAIDDEGVFRSLRPIWDKLSPSFTWAENSKIHTGLSKCSKIHGASLIHKLALVDETGTQLSIWDTQSGRLEYKEEYPEGFGKVRDLDWTFTGDTHENTNAILSVGFSRFVLLYTELRYDYTNKIPTFAVLKKIDISDYTTHEIADSIWIDDGYLAIACGNQFFIDDKWVDLTDSTASSASKSINQTIRQLMIGYNAKPTSYLIADLARILNGPLPLYHPQFLIQALFNNEVKLVEEVLVKLLQVLRDNVPVTWNLDFDFLGAIIPEKTPKLRRRLSQIDASAPDIDGFSSFNTVVSDLLVQKLTKISLPLLTRHQQSTLTTLVNIVNGLTQYKQAMDENGLKFLLGFKLFQSSSKQSHLTMRDINWALHSDQKEALFSEVDAIFNHRMTWDNIKQTGLAYWTSTTRLTTVVENVAKNEFSDNRDPSGRVSVLYLAIKKKQVLLGLWRTVSHPEREKILKFMSNDFTEKHWQTLASKNAFVLLGRHRYMDAAYFFLLGGYVKDCCITLCNKLDEIELALTVAKVNDAADVTKYIIENYILPKAISKGDRWMTSCVFWQLKLKEVSIQALIKSPSTVVSENLDQFSEAFQKDFAKMTLEVQSYSFLRDDPLLAVLFHNLRASKVKYLEGSKAVTPQEEYDFVIKVCGIYSRMGCDYLGLLLARNWKFLKAQERHQETPASQDLFKEFTGFKPQSKTPAVEVGFQEPDMSAFNFGF